MAFPNRYPGTCCECGHDVPAEHGICIKGGTGWEVFHDGPLACEQARANAAKMEAERPTLSDPVTTVGIYRTPDDTLWKVQLSEYGRFYAKQVVVHDGVNPTIELRYVPGGISRIGASMKLTQDEAAAFGARFKICIDCGADLSNFRSYVAGYGRKCASNNGWWYPTPSEARAIIAEREIDLPAKVSA